MLRRGEPGRMNRRSIDVVSAREAILMGGSEYLVSEVSEDACWPPGSHTVGQWDGPLNNPNRCTTSLVNLEPHQQMQPNRALAADGLKN